MWFTQNDRILLASAPMHGTVHNIKKKKFSPNDKFPGFIINPIIQNGILLFSVVK